MKNFTTAFFCCHKTNTGRHLQRHCWMPPPVPMAEIAWGAILMKLFCNVCSDFYMEKNWLLYGLSRIILLSSFKILNSVSIISDPELGRYFLNLFFPNSQLLIIASSPRRPHRSCSRGNKWQLITLNQMEKMFFQGVSSRLTQNRSIIIMI